MPTNDKQWKAYELVFDAIMALSDDKQCYQLSEKTVAMLLSQTGYFHWFTRWNKTDGLSADDKSAIIDLANNAESELLSGGICDAPLPDDSNCFDYMPDAPFLQYAPQDPFSQPDTIPDGYILPPFYHNAAIPLPGVLPDDAMVNFAAIPIFANIADILASGFPRIRLNLRGEGKVTIHLVTIVQGGVVLITTDEDPLTSRLVDLNYFTFFDASFFEDIFDIVIGGVTDNTSLQEIEVVGAGTHTIDITFLPSVSATEILGFGGGLRMIELCGFSELGDYAMPEFQITSCILQWRPNSGAAWTDLGNVCGTDGTDGLTPLITSDNSETGHHKIYLAESDAPEDTVLLADILDGADGADGADGECPDCPPITQDLCRFAHATVDAWWIQISAMLNDLQAYKDANPSDTYIQASDAIYSGIGFANTGQGSLTDLLAIIYDADGIETFHTTTAAQTDEIACALFNSLTEDYISDVVLSSWFDCVSPIVTDSVMFSLFLPSLGQYRLWEVSQFPSTAPADCSGCEPCGGETGYRCTSYDFIEQGIATVHFFVGIYGVGGISQGCVGSTGSMNIAQTFGNGTAWRIPHFELSVFVDGTLGANWYLYGATADSNVAPAGELIGSGTSTPGSHTLIVNNTNGHYYYGYQLVIDTPSGCGTDNVYLTAINFCSPDLDAAEIE